MADNVAAPSLEDLLEAWREGRLDCPSCPVCGRPYAPGDSLTTEHDYVDVHDVVEMWPGGPVVEATWEPPVRQRLERSWVTGECGHRVDRADVDGVWVLRPRTSDAPPTPPARV